MFQKDSEIKSELLCEAHFFNVFILFSWLQMLWSIKMENFLNMKTKLLNYQRLPYSML